MFHAHKLLPGVRDGLGPARLLTGSVTYAEKMTLPRGAKLRVQLRDGSGSSPDAVLAEQVVRSGWAVPIPFALRLPHDAPLQGRKLSLTASLVLDHQTLFSVGRAAHHCGRRPDAGRQASVRRSGHAQCPDHEAMNGWPARFLN